MRRPLAALRFGLLILALNFTACQPAPTVTRHSLFAFGTLIDITLFDVDARQAENVIDQLETLFHHFHHDWSPWTDGELAALNRALASGQTFTLSDELLPLVVDSLRLAEQSRGHFNPLIGNMINLWQFHRHDQADIAPPSPAQIQRCLAQRPVPGDIVIEDHRIHSRTRFAQFSLGAFAKGYGVKRALEHLQRQGIHHAVINAGGDLAVIGRHGKRNWRTGIRDPERDGVIATLDTLPGESVFTSGDYERYYRYNGVRYHHILDPGTCRPTRGFSSVTVIHTDAGVADAAATALMVAGPQRWVEVAKSMRLESILLIDEKNEVTMTPAMAQRAVLSDDIPFTVSDAL